MLNSHLAAKSFFSGLILGLGKEKKEIPFPFPLSDLLEHPYKQHKSPFSQHCLLSHVYTGQALAALHIGSRATVTS